MAPSTPANFDTTAWIDPFLSDCDVLEFVSIVLVGTGVEEVVLGIKELVVVVGRLVYWYPSTPLTFWTGEILSFELRYTPCPSICAALRISHPVVDMRG